MSTIKILDTITANQIAAGEVVERPASVVKELVENSLDAGASVVMISIQNGGITAIEVSDNGCGMDAEDVRLAFLRHSTSKLTSVDDFNRITTMGFRGEALASIASVSKVTLKSKRIQADNGYMVALEGGIITAENSIGINEGTGIIVESLFYNTPARYKFLKKDSLEASYVTDIVERFVLARPDVSFKLYINKAEILHSPGNNDLKSAIFSIYGKAITDSILPINYESGNLKISGYTGKPEISRKTRQHQSIFVNQRYIKSSAITSAIEEAYKTLLMKGQFAFCVLNIDVPPSLVDVNVHPQKTTVKFWNEGDVFKTVMYAIKEAIDGKITIPAISNPTAVQSADEFAYTGIPAEADAVALNEPAAEYKQTSLPMTGNPQEVRFSQNVLQPEESGSETMKPAGSNKSIIDEAVFDSLSDMKFSGTLFNTYLLFESGDSIILIDQHAAHERILFEEMLDVYQNKKLQPQVLLTPEIIEIAQSEMHLINDNDEILKSLGFECEPFGIKSVLLRTIPLGSTLLNPVNALRSVLDYLISESLDEKISISNVLYSMACKAAVKAHDRLKPEEIQKLVHKLSIISRNTHCPHGRPISVKVSKYEIEKWFKRVVG
ncbi:MAG: DNA mismatch repair endonuclease MutL [Saccharofermentanales bacterium]